MTPHPQSPDAAGSPRSSSTRDALYYAILIVVAAIPYLNTLGASFVYDDNYQIVLNPYLRSFHYLRQILFTPVWSFKYAHVPTNYYRPLMPLQYLLTYKTYGPIAYVFHLTNVIFNIGVVLLLFAITRRLFKSDHIAFIAAALFALHPIHTEVVAWVAALPDLQLALLLLATFWFYLDLGEAQRRSWWKFAVMCGFFFLALFAKEPAVVFPLIITLYEHFLNPERDLTTWRQKFSKYAPLWGLTGLYLCIRVLMIGGLVPKVQHARLSWYSTFLSAVSLFGQYMNKLVWPVHLLMFYPQNFTTSMRDPAFLAGTAWVVGICILAALLWKRHKLELFGIVWMVGILSVALNSRWMPVNVFAERYLYIPSIGFCWMIASAAVHVWDSLKSPRYVWARATALSAAVSVCLLLSARTFTRNRDWQSDLTLFSDSVRQNPTSSDLHSDLGFAFWAVHNRAAALEQWDIALKYKPNSFWVMNNLGMVAVTDGRFADALPLLQHAVQLSPQFTDGHLNLAEAYAGLGQIGNAEKEYEAATDSSPLDWDVHNHFAAFYQSLGRDEDARKQYQLSVDSTANAQGLDGLGDIALSRGQKDLAERYFRQAADLDSFDHHAHYQLVFLYGESGRLSEARREFALGQQTDVGTDKLSTDAKALLDSLAAK